MTLDIARVRAAFPGRTIDYYDTITSTMHAAAGRPLGTVIVANAQTAGEGRHGHSWYSEPGSGIYCSVVLDSAAVLTLALGLATAEAISAVAGVACDLRWPNDVLIGGKKVAGILVQLVEDRAIGGIGINVNHASFPPELAAEATSLRLQTGRMWGREDMLTALLRAIETFAQLPKHAVLDMFARVSSYVAGRRVTVEQAGGGAIEGITAGLDPDGYLLVRKDDGTDTLVLAGGVRAVSA